MMRQDDVQVGMAVQFLTPDGTPDLVGLVQRVDDGYVWIRGARWPLDVVAHHSTVVQRPSPEHQWDGALDRWVLPTAQVPSSAAIMLGHARHG